MKQSCTNSPQQRPLTLSMAWHPSAGGVGAEQRQAASKHAGGVGAEQRQASKHAANSLHTPSYSITCQHVPHAESAFDAHLMRSCSCLSFWFSATCRSSCACSAASLAAFSDMHSSRWRCCCCTLTARCLVCLMRLQHVAASEHAHEHISRADGSCLEATSAGITGTSTCTRVTLMFQASRQPQPALSAARVVHAAAPMCSCWHNSYAPVSSLFFLLQLPDPVV
jgi:hypothetical protein